MLDTVSAQTAQSKKYINTAEPAAAPVCVYIGGVSEHFRVKVTCVLEVLRAVQQHSKYTI